MMMIQMMIVIQKKYIHGSGDGDDDDNDNSNDNISLWFNCDSPVIAIQML